MSLVGTLSDLALAELLQMAALTSKSGVLEIRAGDATARVGFVRGMVVRVALADGSLDRKRLLTEWGLDPGDGTEEAEQQLQRHAVESLLDMFTWTEGVFSFDLDADPEAGWPGPPGLELPWSVSPQFLALEGARLGDERAEHGSAEIEAVRSPPELEIESLRQPTTLIVIDGRLTLLESIKDALADSPIRVHIFQSPQDGLARFKQYLLRGDIPALVLGDGVFDPVEPTRRPGAHAFAARARSLAATVAIVHLASDRRRQRSPIDVFVPPPELEEEGEQEGQFLARLRRALGVDA